MNRYEELAVAQDVSLEEIHQAYQALARLLHPDNQSDPKLKSAAERQMIRLNEILATLADPGKRRKYDESLCTKLVVPEAAPATTDTHAPAETAIALDSGVRHSGWRGPLVFAIQRGRRSSSPGTFCPIRSKQSLLRPHHLQVETGHPRDH
jgi:curved DNA-binding protein CbpA